MKLEETEEFWDLALIFFDGADKVREGESNSTPEHVVTRLKEILPKTFTRENPYQVYMRVSAIMSALYANKLTITYAQN
ncbi:hypothetical protein [Pedobacter panaciterrae]